MKSSTLRCRTFFETALLGAVVALAPVAAAAQNAMAQAPGTAPAPRSVPFPARPEAVATAPAGTHAGACATAQPVATAACAGVLAAGGNAFDAAVATSATLAVVEPFGSGLGGGGFFLLHEAGADGRAAREVFLDGRERAPAAATRDMYLGADGRVSSERSRYGALSAAVPHQAALIEHTARRYATRPLAVLLAPAIAAARDGFVVDTRLADTIADNAERMDPEMRAVFAPGGTPLAAGRMLRQPALAATLERWAANGEREFRTGVTAQRLLAGVRAGGGIWTPADLAGVEVTERAPLVGWFRDTRVVTAPPPSAGGAAILESLTMLEAKGFRSLADVTGKHLFAEAARRAYWDRRNWFGDPDYVSIPLARLLGRGHLLPLAADINPALATPSSALQGEPAEAVAEHTTHFGVIDAAGNRVAATQSLNLFFGAGVMPFGTGVVLNDTMDDFAADPKGSNAYGLAGSEANAVAGGKRPLSSMSPTFAEGPNGVLVTGTPGGSRIPTMVLISVLRFVEGASAADIAATPRIHHQYLPDVLQHEPGALTADEQAALAALGHTVKAAREPWGNLSALRLRRDGGIEAAADPRWVGTAAVVPFR